MVTTERMSNMITSITPRYEQTPDRTSVRFQLRMIMSGSEVAIVDIIC